MSDLNPYEKYLDGRPLESILASSPSQIAALLAAIGPEKSALPPAPGKWSPAEIVCHLADCELTFGFRLRQTLAEDNHVIQPFDQEKWAATYPGIAAAQALAVFTASVSTRASWNPRARCGRSSARALRRSASRTACRSAVLRPLNETS